MATEVSDADRSTRACRPVTRAMRTASRPPSGANGLGLLVVLAFWQAVVPSGWKPSFVLPGLSPSPRISGHSARSPCCGRPSKPPWAGRFTGSPWRW